MAETDNASQICGGDRQAAQAISDVSDGDVRDVCETLRGFPSHAVKDLLSLGVCLRCILRLLGIRGELYDPCTLSLSSILSSVFGDLTDSEKHTINDASVENGKCSESPNLKELEVNEALCSLCLGILQFSYCDDKASVVRKDSAYDFASSIVELVKQEGHQIDGFSLEVSIPPVIQENEQSVCLSMKKKYESESWFQRKSLSEHDSVKDALKTCVTKSLEKLLDCNSNMSTFRVRLTYTQAESSKMVQTFVERKQGCKRRKAVTGTDNDLETVDGIKVTNFPCDEIDAVIESSLESCQDSGLSDRVSEPCQLVFHCCRTHIYFGGRYLKYSRNVSQTRWIIDDERMGDASVEELIGSNILPVCRGDSYKFHAAGREDIDVRMLGSGRPFLVEIQNARHLPCDEDVKNIEEKINNLENKLVGVRNLKIMGSQGWTLMHEGEAEKQKQYAALVWISRPFKDDDLQSISSYKEMRVLQKTPIRVLHRRSPLEREKIIHWMKFEKIVGSSQYFLLHLCTQAGTYIKEFVHGDLGRTYPSIGTILGCRAEIIQLDVTDVKMDCF